MVDKNIDLDWLAFDKFVEETLDRIKQNLFK